MIILKKKYNTQFKKFFKFFDKNYINNKNFDKSMWNYNYLIINNIDDKILFYTNNIVESFNRTLNKKYVGMYKTIFNYKNALIDIISFYNLKNIYQERRCSLTRTLEDYVKIETEFKLITNESIKDIK